MGAHKPSLSKVVSSIGGVGAVANVDAVSNVERGVGNEWWSPHDLQHAIHVHGVGGVEEVKV